MRSTEPIARRAQDLLPTVTGFGMTEVGCAGILSYPDSDFEDRTTMSGWPLPGYELRSSIRRVGPPSHRACSGKSAFVDIT